MTGELQLFNIPQIHIKTNFKIINNQNKKYVTLYSLLFEWNI